MLSLGTLRFPMLHFGRRALIGAVVIPSAAAGGSYAYIQYRLSTKPTFTPRILVDHNGQLLEHGGVRVPHISSVSIIMRALQLLVMYAPLLAVYPLLCHFRRVYIFWLRVLLAVVQRSGPAMIKFGQWICTRHDMVSIEFRTVFHALYSHVHTHPSAISIQTIEEELGAPLDTWFSEFDPVPIGSGSIGQCHRAVWKPTGEEVVIKVMHPNVIHDVTIDIYLINWAANWISQLSSSSQYMRLPRTALAWTNHLAAQINFNIEAENLSIFRANFAHGSYATFPAPVHSTPRLLVETFAKGELATDEYLQSLPKASRDLVAYIGLNTLCQMILRDNLIHCDMHPGNIIIDASTDPHHPKVTLIDVGLAQHLTPMDANIMDALISGYVHWNAESTARAMLSMSQNQDFCDEAVFIERMNSLFAYFRPGGEGAEYAVVGNVLHGCFDAVRESHVQLDPQFVHIMLAVLVLEGLIMKLNPLFNIAQQTAPWLVGEGYISTSVWKNLTKTLWVRQKHFLERIVGKYSDQSLEWKS